MNAPESGITIIGLGPGNPALRTVGAQQVLDAADRIILRTRIHPGLDDLAIDPRVTDCDDLYESAANFDVLYPAIARRVLDAAQSGGVVVFAVPGHPRIGERAVSQIEAGARELGIPTDVKDAVSFLDVTAGAIAMDPIARGLQVVDAEELAQIIACDPFASGQLSIDPVRPLLVAQLYNWDLASAVKIALSRVYPDDYLVTIVRAAGIPGEQAVHELPLHALDRLDVDYLTSLWVPPLAPLEAVRSSESLTRIVARLRAPGGCPERRPGRSVRGRGRDRQRRSWRTSRRAGRSTSVGCDASADCGRKWRVSHRGRFRGGQPQTDSPSSACVWFSFRHHA
jgi:tetrapyrrole methylase family protein / MazG family protein